MKVIKGLALLCLLMLAGCQSEEETSQFLLACKYDAPATIEAMLNNGIDVDGQDKTGLSGLMVAAAENRRDVVALLLKRQAKPNLQTRQGVTALMLAAAGMIPIWCWRCRPPVWRWISRTVKDSRRCRWRRVRGRLR